MSGKVEMWLGSCDEVRARIRRELEETRFLSVKDGWMEVPPSEETVENLFRAIMDLHESLRPTYLSWWRTGKLEEGFSVEGFTVRDIRQKLGLLPISVVFTWFDGLTREPEVARRRFYSIPDRRHFIVRTQPLN